MKTVVNKDILFFSRANQRCMHFHPRLLIILLLLKQTHKWYKTDCIWSASDKNQFGICLLYIKLYKTTQSDSFDWLQRFHAHNPVMLWLLQVGVPLRILWGILHLPWHPVPYEYLKNTPTSCSHSSTVLHKTLLYIASQDKSGCVDILRVYMFLTPENIKIY